MTATHKFMQFCTACWMSLLLISCGGGSSNNENGAAIETGQLLDSAVSGVSYRTETQTGITNANGEFSYKAGETVIFSIGNIVFPAVSVSGIITPLEIAGSTDITNSVVVNITRLLQTMDSDGNPENGITIDTSIPTVVLDFSQSLDNFVAQVLNQMAITLVDKDQAISHLQNQIDNLNNNSMEVSATIPASIAGSYNLTFGSAQNGSPVSDDTQTTFTVLDSGELRFADTVLVNPVIRNGNVHEAIWIDSVNLTEYALSSLVTGFNEINLSGLNGVPFYGQYSDQQITTPTLFQLKVDISGLPANTSITVNNGSDSITVENGLSSFTNSLQSDSSYNVEVTTAPSEVSCSLGSNSSGSITEDTVVSITCESIQQQPQFNVQGAIIGTVSGQWELYSNGAFVNDGPLTENNAVTFAQLDDGASYEIRVSNQQCQLSNFVGFINGADHTLVSIDCSISSAAYTVGGTISGLTSPVQLELVDGNGVLLDDIPSQDNGSFSFNVQLNDGQAFQIIPPSSTNLGCSVTNVTSTIMSADIDAMITCSGPVAGMLQINTIASNMVRYANGVYTTGTHYSLDGSSWIESNNYIGGSDLVFDGSQWISVPGSIASNGIMQTSPDAINWTDLSSSQCSLQCLGILVMAANGSNYVANAQSSGDVIISTDLLNWSKVAAANVSGFIDIENIGSTFVALSNAGEIVVSHDNGASWSYVHDTPSSEVSLATDGTNFYVFSTTHISKSVDGGDSWTDISLGVNYGNSALSMAVDANQIMLGLSYSFLAGATIDSIDFLNGVDFNTSPQPKNINEIASGPLGVALATSNGIWFGNPVLK